MFAVTITADAKDKIAELFAQDAFSKPGLTIHRQGPKADVVRSVAGQAAWKVERPHPWRAQVGDFQSFGENAEDVSAVEGILVWLAFTPRPGELGIHVSVRNGELFVEARGA